MSVKVTNWILDMALKGEEGLTWKQLELDPGLYFLNMFLFLQGQIQKLDFFFSLKHTKGANHH